MNKIILIAVSAVLFSYNTLAQNYTPVAVRGFNYDGVAENSPASSYTTGPIDGSGYALYSVAYGNIFGTGEGLPDNGTIQTSIGTYQLRPYTLNNMFFDTIGATDTMTLLAPASYASVSLLGFSTEGDGPNTITLVFTDGTTLDSSIILPDWFDGFPNVVYSGFDRTSIPNDEPDFLFGEPYMYATNFNIPCSYQTKLLQSIIIANTGTNPRTCFMALSGAALPSVSYTATADCHGNGQGTATALVSGGIGPFGYAWSTIPAQDSIVAIGLTAGAYTVTVTDSSQGCTVSGIATVVYPTVASHTASPSDTVCAGSTVTLSGTGADLYTWTGGIANGVAFTPAVSATFQLSAIDTIYGCSYTDSASIVVSTLPAVELSITPADTICAGSDATLTGIGAGSYAWSGGVTNGVAFSPASTATYTVTVTGANGCTQTDSVRIAVTTCQTGIAEVQTAYGISVYPNPSSGDFTLMVNAAESEIKIEITDIQGRSIYASTEEDIQSGYTKHISLTNASAGIYVLSVRSGSKQYIQKISLQ
jgi:hypothetical protein